MRAAIAVVVAVLAFAPAAAHALPGDPGFEPLTPAGGATLPVDPNGIPVTFTCPVYRTYDAGDGFALYGGPKDYRVLMAAEGEGTGPDGRLTNPVAIVDGQAVPGQDGHCAVLLGAGGSVRPQETPGAYRWQVSRLCTGCAGGYEVGPIRTLVLVTTVDPKVSAPGRAFAGYPFLVKVAAEGAANGTTVTVERRTGPSSWVKAGTGTVASGVAEVVVTVRKRGSATLRARLKTGSADAIGTGKAIKIASASTRATAVRAGRWTGNHDVSFTVSGRTVKTFTGRIPMLCPTPGMVSPFTTMIGTASLKHVRLAPDGSFVGTATASGTAIRVRGRLRGARSSGGRIELSTAGCTGNASFSARAGGAGGAR